MRNLTNDAKSVFTGMFGMGQELSFRLGEMRPTARCNAALMELELVGAIGRVVDRVERKIVYRANPDLSDKDLRALRVPLSKMAGVKIAEPRETADLTA